VPVAWGNRLEARQETEGIPRPGAAAAAAAAWV